MDRRFSVAIIDVIETDYFESKYFKLILQHIKEYYHKYSKIPSFETLEQVIKSEINQETILKVTLDTVEKIKMAPLDGIELVQDKALKFCKQQRLRIAVKEVDSIIDKGDFENYDQAEKLINDALNIGNFDKDRTDVFDDVEDVLKEDYRKPIPTGIKGFDRLMKGGLARGEVGLIIAPTGVGKTTLMTKFANHAYNTGHNVLQIFFEDNPSIIKRKHYTLWTQIHPDDLTEMKDAVISKVNEIKNTMPNRLIMEKLPSETLTMTNIKNRVRKLISEGVKIDLICLDYIDCVLPDKFYKDDWKGEGSVIRKFEAMCYELDIAGWVATQGNRESISSEVVTTDQMGGSIKKGQVGHIIVTVAKTLQQKENKLATIAITKSRIGDDGVIFENCKFDNAMIDIDTDTSTTFLGHEEDRQTQARLRQRELWEKRQQREQVK